MGCFGSRDSQRQEKFGQDYTLVPNAFRKAALENLTAFAPVDKLAAEFIGQEKDITESKIGEFKDLNFSNADELKKVAEQIFNLIKGVHKAAKNEADDKENAFCNKYKYKDVVEQLDSALTAIAATDAEKLKWPEEEAKADDAPKEEAKDGEPPKEEEAKEGGDEDQYDGGEGTFPDVLLKQCLASPVLFDMIKAAVLSVELDSFDPLDFGKLGKMAISFIPLLPDPKEWAGAAAILCIMVNHLEADAADKEIWATMKVSEDDLAELKEAWAEKDKCALVFPGLSQWYGEKADCPAPAGPENATLVTICLKGAKYYECDGKFVICRFIGKLEEEKEGNEYVLSELTDFVFENIGAWKGAIAKAAGDAAAPAEAAKDEPAKDGEAPKEEAKDAEAA